MQIDFFDLRLFFKVLDKGNGRAAVPNFLLGQIHSGKGNKVILAPISAHHLFKGRKR